MENNANDNNSDSDNNINITITNDSDNSDEDNDEICHLCKFSVIMYIIMIGIIMLIIYLMMKI